MLAIVACSALGVVVGQVLRRLGLRQDHRERVADHVVHVAGQPGLLLAQLGDLLGLVGLAHGLRRLLLGHDLGRPESRARAANRSARPASQGSAQDRRAPARRRRPARCRRTRRTSRTGSAERDRVSAP